MSHKILRLTFPTVTPKFAPRTTCSVVGASQNLSLQSRQLSTTSPSKLTPLLSVRHNTFRDQRRSRRAKSLEIRSAQSFSTLNQETLSQDPYDDIPAIKSSTEIEDAAVSQLAEFLSTDPSGIESGFKGARSINGHVVIQPTLRSIDGSGMTVTVTINNPKKLNSLSSQLIADLTTAFKVISRVPSTRAVILRGRFNNKSPSFCSGAFIPEMSQINSPAEAEAFIRKVSALNNSVRECPSVVIAFIDGYCYGAGLELAASCDLRYGTSRSTFSMPEVKIGIPSVVQARMLCDIIGWAKTRNLTLLGNTISAPEALAIGLLDQVSGFSRTKATRAQILTVVDDVAKDLMETTGAQGVRAQKELMCQWEGMTVNEGIEASVKTFASMWQDGGSEPKRYMQKALDNLARRKAEKREAEKQAMNKTQRIPYHHDQVEGEEDRANFPNRGVRYVE